MIKNAIALHIACISTHQAAVKSLYSSIKASLFGLATTTNTTHHPKAEAKTVEFAHLSLCHVLLPFVDSVSLLHKKKMCRRGLTMWRTSQVMAPDLPLWAPLRSILGQKLSGNLRAQSLCVSTQKCHPFWCVKRFKLWFMRLCMSMHAIFDSEVHMSNNINNTCTQRKLSLPLQFSHLFCGLPSTNFAVMQGCWRLSHTQKPNFETGSLSFSQERLDW